MAEFMGQFISVSAASTEIYADNCVGLADPSDARWRPQTQASERPLWSRRIASRGRFLPARLLIAAFSEQVSDIEETDVEHVADNEDCVGGLDLFQHFPVY